MNFNILSIILFIIYPFNALSFKFNYLDPLYVEKSFVSKIDTHQMELSLSNVNEINDYMLLISFIDTNFDRLPPDYGYKYCLNNNELVVRDWSYQESFYYSCCSKSFNCNNNTCYYTCPIPPANPSPDPFRTFFTEDICSIYIKELSSQSNWTLLNQKFIYKESNSFEGFLKKF